MNWSLRSYQKSCVDAIWNHVRTREDNPIAVLPTGSGKGWILAKLAKDVVGFGGKALILADVKELLSQTFENIQKLAPEIPLGAYSAGLGARDIHYPIIVAGIQSCYERAAEFGKVDIVMVDEVHKVQPEGEGRYRTFLNGLKAQNENVRLIGVSATPFRLSTGPICGPDNLFNSTAYEIGIRELVRDGFLAPLKARAGRIEPDLAQVHIRAGEFVAEELEAAMNAEEKIAMAVLEILELTQDRKSVLVFACGVRHGHAIARAFREATDSVAEIYGDTDYDERDSIVERFRNGTLKYLVNVNVLSTGFDAPGVDAIAMLRPTMSPGLMMQQLGRGFRISPGKENCIVLDFSGNIQRHGPVDAIRISTKSGDGTGKAPAKMCPDCRALMAAGCATCPECGYEFPARTANHAAHASGDDPMADMGPRDFPVLSVKSWKHRKKDSVLDAPSTLQVRYKCGEYAEFSEWVCFEHSGFARTKAAQWWRARGSTPCPATVDEALARWSELSMPTRIRVKPDGKYTRVIWAGDFVAPPPPATEKIENGLTDAKSEIGF